MAESKAAKKNRKRKVNKGAPKTGGFEIDDDVSEPVTPPKAQPKAAAAVLDPVEELRRQIEEAKAAKDHKKAQELRQKMWVLRDTLSLGKAGPGAPDVDIQDILAEVKQSPDKPPPSSTNASSLGHSSAGGSSADPTEKKLSRLRKKLKQIEDLKAKRDSGMTLESNQIEKIKTESDVLEEISILEQLLTGNL